MSTKFTVDEKLIEAFHLMFDNFPEAAQLAHKTKEIVALNPACRAIGREVGMICAKHGAPETHKGCLATRMFKEQKVQWAKANQTIPGGQEPVTFWLPIEGHPDFFIHFSIGYTKNYSTPS